MSCVAIIAKYGGFGLAGTRSGTTVVEYEYNSFEFSYL